MTALKQFQMSGGQGWVQVLATSEVTHHAFTLSAYHLPPGGEIPAHAHALEDEILTPLQGDFESFNGIEWNPMAHGQSVTGMRGRVHGFRNSGAAPGVLLSITTPGGYDLFLEAVSTLTLPQDMVRLSEISKRFGITHPPPSQSYFNRSQPEANKPPLKCFKVFGEPVEILVSMEETTQAFTILTQTSPPGGGPPLHRHTFEDEIFTVVAGEYEVFDSGIWTKLLPGDVAYALRGSIHTFRNCGSQTGKLQAVIVPGTELEHYLEDISVLTLPQDALRVLEISAQYGLEVFRPSGVVLPH
ncbi:MAG: cupin domain-containing protein [Janthinobacterium lividum]